MNRILEFFQEDNGGYSATRLGFLLWVIGALVVWIITSLTSEPRQLARVDPSVVTIVGILMTGKVAQKFGEKPDPAALPPDPAALPPGPATVKTGIVNLPTGQTP